MVSASFVLDRHVVKWWNTNDEVWKHIYTYFQRHLPIMLWHHLRMNQSPCAIFDIDFTVVRYSMFQHPPHGLRITSPYALLLYRLLQQYRVPIYFVTARPSFPYNESWTRQELETLKLTQYQGLYLMPMNQSDVGKYKLNVRNQLRSKHWILLNIGDQWTDLTNENINDNKYSRPGILYNLEPQSDWSVKLIEPPSFLSTMQPTNFSKPYLDSIFETITF